MDSNLQLAYVQTQINAINASVSSLQAGVKALQDEQSGRFVQEGIEEKLFRAASLYAEINDRLG